MYNGKVDKRSEFAFCLYSAYNEEMVIPATWLQYGYQIYGLSSSSQEDSEDNRF